MRKSLLLGVMLAGLSVPAFAETIAATHAANIDLGTTRGSAYYIVANDGYHVVATLQSGFASTPIRFNAVLAEGQSASVSIPGPHGTRATEVVFTRSADHLDVRQSTDLADLATQ